MVRFFEIKLDESCDEFVWRHSIRAISAFTSR
jgi:hypothetical protein